MQKHIIFQVLHFLQHFFKAFNTFLSFLASYSQKKILTTSYSFEKQKNVLVHFFMMKRGRYNRPFLHMATISVLALGVVLAPFLAETFPIFSEGNPKLKIGSPQTKQSIIVGENVFQTDISQKPRDKIITYTVQKGDTVSTIANKFGISANTVRWANDLTGDGLAIGDQLKILPVSGIAHKVEKGDNINSIAKKYAASSQAIADFPFNDFANPETFSLVEGEILIVPDGIKPSEQPYIKQQIYIAQGPSDTTPSAAGFTWPVRGSISQFASWYHMALDISSPVGTPIVAANSGTIVAVSVGGWDGGYGNNVYIQDANGYKTHYAHMQAVNVSVGQSVTRGRTVVGWVGLTGRTTGSHLHFEIIKGGTLVNPLPYLQ